MHIIPPVSDALQLTDLKNSWLYILGSKVKLCSCNGSTTLQDHTRQVLQHSHCRKTLAYKDANHLTTLNNRAPLLRVKTTLHNDRTNVRETICDHFDRKVLPLNFKHVQKSDATESEQKISCNKCDASCNVCDSSYELKKIRSQSVLKWSGVNCERGLTLTCNQCNCERDV